MFCEFCGNRLEEDDKFCPYCGAAVPEEEAIDDSVWLEQNMNDSGMQHPKKSKGKIGVIVGLAVLLLAGAAAGAFFAFGGADHFQSEEQEEREEKEEQDTLRAEEDSEGETAEKDEEKKEEEEKEYKADSNESDSDETDGKEKNLTEDGKTEEEEAFQDTPGTATGLVRGTEEVYMAQFSASASSILKETGYSYSESNLSDLNPATCWADGVQGNGVNESILFVSGKKQRVRGIAILPGFFKSEDLYYKNGAPSKIRVECDDEQVFTFEVTNTSWNFEGDLLGNMCYFDFGEEVITDECKVTILAVKDGNKYDDCCITEMFLYK